MTFSTQTPLTLTGAVFDASSNEVILNFVDVCPADEPNPVDWVPTKRFSVAFQTTDGIIEVPLNGPNVTPQA